jgi:DNA-directed RNA polymerase III subunit RPC4
VLLDQTGKRVVVLGEVEKRFVVSPDVDALLAALKAADLAGSMVDTEGMVRMDVDE